MFTAEVERALLDGRVDLAVHSLKDLPIQQPEGLILAAIPEREDPRGMRGFQRTMPPLWICQRALWLRQDHFADGARFCIAIHI